MDRTAPPLPLDDRTDDHPTSEPDFVAPAGRDREPFGQRIPPAPEPRRYRTALFLAPIVVAAAVVGAAFSCTRGGGPATDASLSTAPSITSAPLGGATPTAPPVTEQQWTTEQRQVLAAYDEFRENFRSATRDPARGDRVLAERTTGVQLRADQGEIARLRSMGFATRPALDSLNRTEAVSVSFDELGATAVECILDNDVIFRVVDGSVVNDATSTRKVEARLVRVDGVWRVGGNAEKQKWAGSEMHQCTG
jgi:hypothetical protein